jgi:hypothetical protein
MQQFVINTGTTKEQKRLDMVEDLRVVGKLVADRYLSDSDWKVIRHRDQVELGITTSLTAQEYNKILQDRQKIREKSVLFEDAIDDASFNDIQLLHRNMKFFNSEAIQPDFTQHFLDNATAQNVIALLVDFINVYQGGGI